MFIKLVFNGGNATRKADEDADDAPTENPEQYSDETSEDDE